MKKIWPWIIGIAFGLFTIAWLFAGRSERQSYHAARGDSTGRSSLLGRSSTPEESESAAATPLPADSGCLLVSQSPADGTLIPPGTEFTTTWVLQNTGDEKWAEGEVDIRFVSALEGTLLHLGLDVYDLTANVKPGAEYGFTVPMIAPSTPGSYGETWEISLGSQQLCPFSVSIQVE
jgi:hypothetical protein